MSEECYNTITVQLHNWNIYSAHYLCQRTASQTHTRMNKHIYTHIGFSTTQQL